MITLPINHRKPDFVGKAWALVTYYTGVYLITKPMAHDFPARDLKQSFVMNSGYAVSNFSFYRNSLAVRLSLAISTFRDNRGISPPWHMH